MRPRPRPFLFLLLLLPLASPARAQKLDKDDKKWLDDVRPLLLPDEEKTFESSRTRPTGWSSRRSSGRGAIPTSTRPKRVPGRVREG